MDSKDQYKLTKLGVTIFRVCEIKDDEEKYFCIKNKSKNNPEWKIYHNYIQSQAELKRIVTLIKNNPKSVIE